MNKEQKEYLNRNQWLRGIIEKRGLLYGSVGGQPSLRTAEIMTRKIQKEVGVFDLFEFGGMTDAEAIQLVNSRLEGKHD